MTSLFLYIRISGYELWRWAIILYRRVCACGQSGNKLIFNKQERNARNIPMKYVLNPHPPRLTDERSDRKQACAPVLAMLYFPLAIYLRKDQKVTTTVNDTALC